MNNSHNYSTFANLLGNDLLKEKEKQPVEPMNSEGNFSFDESVSETTISSSNIKFE